MLLEFGRILVRGNGERLSKWKAVSYAIVGASVLGLLASGDFVSSSGGDYLFDAGEIEDVEENPHPISSGVGIFVYSFTSMCIGIFKKAE